jgi:hypothetical protein
MYTQLDFTKQIKGEQFTGAAAQQKSGTGTGLFLGDNRPAAIAQRKLKEDIAAKHADQPMQLKSDFKNTGQPYTYGSKMVTVGKKMDSWLDPDDLLQGQSANLNKSQDDLMNRIRAKYGLIGGDVVKGHLLNDNLGGTALGKNLYPITRAANNDHLTHVENFVKAHVWVDKRPVYYNLEVVGTPNINSPNAEFVSTVREWDTKKIGNKTGKKLEPHIVVQSSFPVPKNYGQAFELGNPGIESARASNPKKAKGVKRPHTNVADLSADEKKARLSDE